MFMFICSHLLDELPPHPGEAHGPFPDVVLYTKLEGPLAEGAKEN